MFIIICGLMLCSFMFGYVFADKDEQWLLTEGNGTESNGTGGNGTESNATGGNATGMKQSAMGAKSDAIANSADAQIRTVDVKPGDTLWSIARAHRPSHVKTQLYIEQIKLLNGLESPHLTIDQLLYLP